MWWFFFFLVIFFSRYIIGFYFYFLFFFFFYGSFTLDSSYFVIINSLDTKIKKHKWTHDIKLPHNWNPIWNLIEFYLSLSLSLSLSIYIYIYYFQKKHEGLYFGSINKSPSKYLWHATISHNSVIFFIKKTIF